MGVKDAWESEFGKAGREVTLEVLGALLLLAEIKLGEILFIGKLLVVLLTELLGVLFTIGAEWEDEEGSADSKGGAGGGAELEQGAEFCRRAK